MGNDRVPDRWMELIYHHQQWPNLIARSLKHVDSIDIKRQGNVLFTC